jgi:hypothetical protein
MRHRILLTLTFLLFIVFGNNIALANSSAKQVTPVTEDKQVLKFIQSKQPITMKAIDKSNKDMIKSMIADINSMCGNFNNDPQILTDSECTTRDANGNLVTFKVKCQDGNSCLFTKEIHEPITITQTPSSTQVQASPNVPSQSSVSTEKWLKVFAGLIYVVLTIYLLMIASSNLFKREILFLVVDLSLWAALTAAMYVVLKGGF